MRASLHRARPHRVRLGSLRTDALYYGASGKSHRDPKGRKPRLGPKKPGRVSSEQCMPVGVAGGNQWLGPQVLGKVFVFKGRIIVCISGLWGKRGCVMTQVPVMTRSPEERGFLETKKFSELTEKLPRGTQISDAPRLASIPD